MDFQGMKRKDLQALCKKHGVPANLKNSEMAMRLSSLFEKEPEEIVTETKKLPDDAVVDVEDMKDNVVVGKEAKRVRFSPDNEVFEFTRSVKNRKQKNVRSRSKVTVQDLRKSGIDVRRSTRIATKGVTVADFSEIESNTRREIVESGKECIILDDTNLQKVPRRSKRFGSSGSTQEEDCRVFKLIDLEQCDAKNISKGLFGNNQEVERRSTRQIAKRSKGLLDKENIEDELEIVKEVSMDFEVRETGKYHGKDVQDPIVGNVCRRSRRFVSEIDVQTNTQKQRKSMRLKASAANPSIGGGTSDNGKEERKIKQSKRSVAVNSQEGELLNNKTKEPLIDCMRVLDDSEVEKTPRRSKRLGNDVKAVNHDDLEVEKAPQQSRKRGKSVSELLVVDQAQKGDEKPKRTMRGQAMANSLKRCSIIDNERDGASVGNVKKLNVNDEMQVRARFTRNSSRNGSCKNLIIVEGNSVEKKLGEPKKVAKKMKRGRPAKPRMDIKTAFTESNLTPEKLLEEQEDGRGANVEARGSSKKAKTVSQECVMDKPEGMIEDSPSSSEAKAAESVTVIENVLDSTLEKMVDSSQRTKTRELNSKLMEGEREEKLEKDAVLVAVIEEEKEEVSSLSVLLTEHVPPASVQLAGSNPEAEVVVSTGPTLVTDIASTVITEENTKTKDQILICTPISEHKEHSSEADLAKVEDDEKGSLEKEVQAANLHGNLSECNTENSSEEEEMETISVGHCVNLTPEKLLDEVKSSANVEARGSFKKMKTVIQDFVKDNPQGMAEDSPSTSQTKVTEPIMISENVLVSTVKVSGEISSARKTEECDSELVEGEHVEKNEQETVLMAATTDKEEASMLSVSVIECTEVKTCLNNGSAGDYLYEETTPPPTSLELAMSNPKAELGAFIGHILVKDIVSADNTVEDTKTKEDTLACTPRTEFKEHYSDANLAKGEVTLEDSAEIHSNKDDERGSLEKNLQAANSYGNFFDYNTEHSIAEEEMEISKVGCMSVDPCENETPQKLFDAYTQLEPEETWAPNVESIVSSEKIKTVNQEFEKEKPQGMALDLPSTSETKATEAAAISENELDSTPKLSGDISLVRNIHELNSKLMEEELEEKQEQDTCMIAATKDKEESSSSFVFLIERSEMSNPEAELSVETTPPPASEHLAVSHPEAVLGVPTGNILVKDISSTDVLEDDIKTKEEILVSMARTELKEDSFVAKLAEAEAIMENLSQPVAMNNTACSSLDESVVFTTPERNLMLMEQLNKNGEMRAADSVTHQNDEAEESPAVLFTTPEQVMLLGDSGLDEPGKEEEHTATDFLDESDVLNTTENEARIEGESMAVNLLDESNIVTSSVRQSSVEDLKVDGIERNLMLMEQVSENGKIRATQSVVHLNDEAVESHDVVFTTPEKVILLGDFELDDAEKKEVHTTTKFLDESDEVLKATEICYISGGSRKNEASNDGESIVVELHDESNCVGDFKGDGIERNEENSRTLEFPCDSGTCTTPDRHILLGNLVSDGAEDSGGSQGTNRVDKSGLLTSLEKQLFYGDSEQNEAVMTEKKAAAEFHDESGVPKTPERQSFPEDSELNEAAKSEENKVVELRADCTEKHLLFRYSGLDGTRKIGGNVAATCEKSFVFTSPERRLLLGNSEPHNAGKQEQKEVEFKDESAFFTRLESRLLLEESGQDRFDICKSDLSNLASSPKVTLKEHIVVQGSPFAALNLRENTNIDSNDRTASKESTGTKFMPKDPQAENVVGEDATQGMKQSKRESVELFAFKIQEGETIIQAERNVSLSSYVLALPTKGNSCDELSNEGNSETIGEISSHLEVVGMVPEESGHSTDIQNQLNDELEGLAMKGNNEADIVAKVSKNTQARYGGLEDEHLGFDFEVDFRTTCEKSGGKSRENEATDPIATAVEEAISLTPDQFTVQSNTNEQAADEEVIRRETTPSPKETMNENSNTEKQVRREPLLIYGTQVKANVNDMKENAPNSKIVHNLNITAPRISKRKPLQDLKKN